MWRGEGGRWLCGEMRVGGGYVERCGHVWTNFSVC